MHHGDLPGGPVDKTRCSQCRGGFNSCLENQDPTYHSQACTPQVESLHTTMKTQSSRKKKKVLNNKDIIFLEYASK